MTNRNNGGWDVSDWSFVDELTSLTPLWQFIKRKEQNMTTNKTELVELIQTELKTFRASATVQGEPDFRELAVSLVRVFRDHIEAEIKQPDPYDKDPEDVPGKGQGWE